MKYKLCEIKLNPSDSITAITEIKIIAWFAKRTEALDYLDQLNTINLLTDRHFAVIEDTHAKINPSKLSIADCINPTSASQYTFKVTFTLE